ncbi:MAG: VTT domain-containing protein [Archangium sp.]
MKARVLLVVGAIALLVAAWQLGVFERLGEPRLLAQSVRDLGAWGFVAFLVAYAVLHPFGVPGTIFIVAAPIIWPWPTAFALSMVGTMAGSVVGFSFARFLARDWVAARIPPRFKRYDDALAEDPLTTVAVLRLVFWMPPPLHFFFGVSRVPFSTHFWGSVLGYIPPLLACSYFGARVFDDSGHLQPGAWPILGGLVAASLVIAVLARVWEKRQRARRDQNGISVRTR